MPRRGGGVFTAQEIGQIVRREDCTWLLSVYNGGDAESKKRSYPFRIENGWYSAKTAIRCFEAEEHFATKLRVLLQQRKGRELFDLNEGRNRRDIDRDRLIACFEHCLAAEGTPITRAAAEQRMLEKLNRSLTEDIAPLLPVGLAFTEDDAIRAFGRIWFGLVGRIKGGTLEKFRRGDQEDSKG